MYAGQALTVLATVVPYVDRGTAHVPARHIRDGYPTYTQERIDSAVTTWLVILTVGRSTRSRRLVMDHLGGRARKVWAPLVKDTSGGSGLAPLQGWIGVLPCPAGLVAVTMLWRRS